MQNPTPNLPLPSPITRALQSIRQLYRLPTPLEVASRELSIAELNLLQALTASDLAKATVEYQQTRIQRLRKFVNAATAATAAKGGSNE